MPAQGHFRKGLSRVNLVRFTSGTGTYWRSQTLPGRANASIPRCPRLKGSVRNWQSLVYTVAQAALARRESRGAHQREDFPDTKPAWELTQVAALRDERIILSGSHGSALEAAQ
jgi:aspartate oxidase